MTNEVCIFFCEKLSENFEKGIDKLYPVWYNIYSKRVTPRIKKERKKMKKIYVLCQMKNNEMKTFYFNDFEEYNGFIYRHGAEIAKQLKLGTC